MKFAWSPPDVATDMNQLCNLADFSKNGRQLFTVNGQEILVIKSGDRFFAVSNICPHAGGKLIKGRVDDGTITCMEHGLCFDLQSGAVRSDQIDEDLLEMIDIDNLPFGWLKTYETVVDNGFLYINP